MADIDLTGYWSGVAVTRTLRGVVHVYLEQTGTELNGKFDSPDLPGATSSGDVTGSFDGSNLMLNSRTGIRFQGQIAGQTNATEIIYGLLQGSSGVPEGTLTLFRREKGDVTLLYEM